MKSRDYVLVAVKNIGRQKLRSSLTIFAVVIGATSVTIMLALVTSIKDFFVAQYDAAGQTKQVIVTQATDLDYRQAQNGGGPSSNTGVKLTDDVVTKIKGVPHVVNLTPTTYVYIFDSLIYQDKRLAIAGTSAYEPNGTIKHQIVAGRDLQESDGTGVITLTVTYADKLGFGQNYSGLVGQKITLRTQNFFTGEGAVVPSPGPGPQGPGAQGPAQVATPQPVQSKGGAPQPVQGGVAPAPGPAQPSQPGQQNQQPTDLTATVVGVVTAINQDATIYFPLKWARGLLEMRQWQPVPSNPTPQNQPPPRPGQPPPQPQPPPQQQYTLVTQNQLDQQGYGSIIVQADSTSDVDPVAATVRTFGVGAVTAESYIKQQESDFNILALILGGIGAIALAVAAIGVINTMVMAILERTREIGVMRACGATRGTIRRLFTFEAAMLGFWGGVFGVLVGYGLTIAANTIINNQLKLNSINASNIITLPAWLILSVVGATTLIGLLAGLYPAARAARLNPVAALRYE